ELVISNKNRKIKKHLPKIYHNKVYRRGDYHVAFMPRYDKYKGSIWPLAHTYKETIKPLVDSKLGLSHDDFHGNNIMKCRKTGTAILIDPIYVYGPDGERFHYSRTESSFETTTE